MDFMKSWKMKPASGNVAALNPEKVKKMMTPEEDPVKSASVAETQMPKFKGLKRHLAKEKNLFKQSKD
jgi:formylmethanofuran dehydrogenase subunit D